MGAQQGRVSKNLRDFREILRDFRELNRSATRSIKSEYQKVLSLEERRKGGHM